MDLDLTHYIQVSTTKAGTLSPSLETTHSDPSRMHKCQLKVSTNITSGRNKSYLLDPSVSLYLLCCGYSSSVMEWFSWLSKTSLELTLVYDYGVVFACNELTAEDIPHFNHEFLQSMGITTAKHRLEIIKLARSETRSISGIFSGRVRETFDRTKRRLVDCAKKLMTLRQKNPKMVVKYWKGGGQRKVKDKQDKGEVYMLTDHSHDERQGSKSLGFRSPRPRMMMSGPLERSNGQTRIISRGHSGPLAPSGWFPEKSGAGGSPLGTLSLTMCRSPRGAEGIDGIDSLWAKLFQDMKPT